ncbi:MAG: hypothetical protein CMI54_02910 [Parcubacteria group bacterium]|nr:hypothetical protein [Parcubacteria group bacterium]|tara:strand:- start:12991 stop:15441 length:2451 start_codon:yes stop_codon:yes gene_type:complete
MRTIVLNAKSYKVTGEITQRAINPFRGKLGGTGSLEFSDFGQASIEEYHDFRNGIGLQSELPSESNRLWFTEGIDFSTARSAVLSSLVNTADYADWAASTAYSLLNFRIPTTPDGNVYECTNAGTSGGSEPSWDTTVGNTTVDNTVTWTCRNYLAPIKIIDFQDNTYVIQSSRILKWDGTNLDGVDNGEGITLTLRPNADNTNGFETTTDGGGVHYTEVDEATADDDSTKVSFTGNNGNKSQRDLYDIPDPAVTEGTITQVKVYIRWKAVGAGEAGFGGKVSIKTGGTTYESSVSVFDDNVWRTLSNTWTTNPDTSSAWTWAEIRDLLIGGFVSARDDSGTYSGHLSQVYAEILYKPTTYDAIVVTDTTDEYLVVASPSQAIYTPDGTTWSNLVGCQGHLAFLDKKLHGIDIDGRTVRSSPTNNIDGTWTTFDLTGNFGTVYRMFSGKLLADSTPALYFTSNRGLFSIDISNELAYQQEVNYPPRTNAGRSGMYWNANLWVATGAGITKIAPSLATSIGTDQDDGLPSGYQGDVYDMLPVGNWLVFCVNGGSSDKSSIFKRNSSLGGNLQVYTGATNKPIACMHHSPSSLYTNGRLWFGEDTSVKYMMFPDTTSNVKQISTFEYVDDSGGSPYSQLPIFRKLAAISKTALGIAAITKSCDANEYIELYYGLNGASPTTAVGTGSFKTSPKPTTLLFNSGLGTVFYTIQFAIRLIRGSTNTNSPELESLMFYYLPTPTRISGWVCNIEAIGEYADQTFTDFETILDTNTLVAFYPSGDTNKTSYNVKLTQMPSRAWWEEQGGREGAFQVVLEEIFEG